MITMSVKRTKQLQDILKRFPRESEKEVDVWLDKNLRALISSSGNIPGLVQISPPLSEGVKGAEAKKYAQKKVASDIKRVFATASYAFKTIKSKDPIMAQVFWAHIKKGRLEDARKIMAQFSYNVRIKTAPIVDSPDFSFHAGARRKNGTVGKWRNVNQVIVRSGKLNAYIKKIQGRVGYLASSIPTAAGNKFGALKGVPNWVKTKKSGHGYAKRNRRGTRKSTTLGFQRDMSGLQGQFDRVLNKRLKAMERELPSIASALEKKLRARLA